MDTRERMVEVTARLLARQGYHATGLAQVLTEAGAPRGSLYFHFPEGKEQMAAEAVRRLGEQLGVALQAKLDGKPDVRSGLQSVARMFARQLEASEFTLGCPVATLPEPDEGNDGGDPDNSLDDRPALEPRPGRRTDCHAAHRSLS